MKLHLISESISSQKEVEKLPTAQGKDLGQYITTKQAADIVGVSDGRIRQFIQEKRLKAHQPVPGRRDNFLIRADVEAFAKKERERTGRPDEGKGTSKNESVEEVDVEVLEESEVHTHEVCEKGTKKVVGKYKSAEAARRGRDKKDNAYGSYKYFVRKIGEDSETV